MPTLAAIAGNPDLIDELKAGTTLAGKEYKVHLDGFDQSEFLTTVSGTVGTANDAESARDIFYYTDDDMELVAMRQGDYKFVFQEQRAPGTMQVWAEPFTNLRLQKIFNLMQDPYERADITSNTFWDWQLNHVQLMYGVMADVSAFAESFDEFPPRSFPPSFNPANILRRADAADPRRAGAAEAFPMLPDPAQAAQ